MSKISLAKKTTSQQEKVFKRKHYTTILSKQKTSINFKDCGFAIIITEDFTRLSNLGLASEINTQLKLHNNPIRKQICLIYRLQETD